MLRSLARGSGRRPLSIFVTVLLSLFWLSAGPLAAPASAIEPNSIQSTLEGCNIGAAETLSAPFICPDSDYTTGNQGKNWSELDLVPFRLTVNNSGSNTPVYDMIIAADRMDAGHPGYDVMSIPVVNTSKSAVGCSVVAGPQSIEAPGQGGTDETIYRKLTITQPMNSTCVFDWYQRLALGSHLYPGSSLHTNLLNENFGTAGIGAKEVSIPVNEIEPQHLSKTMTAARGAAYSWNVAKSATPSVDLGDTCFPQSSAKDVSVTVSWTRSAPQADGAATLATTITATNPSSRTISVDIVSDAIYAGPTATGTPLTTLTSFDTQTAGPNGGTAVWSFTTTVDSSATQFTDLATAKYIDEYTGVEVPGTTTATATAAVVLSGSPTNSTATLSDVETMSGPYSFAVKSVTGATGTFSPAYTVGSGTKVKSLTWTSGTLSDSGSVTFIKTVTADSPTTTAGTLSDVATLTPASSAALTASASTNITSTASLPTVSFHKTVDIAPLVDTTFTFNVFSGGTKVGETSVTIKAGQTTATSAPLSVPVSANGYTWTEDFVAGYNSNINTGVKGTIGPLGYCATTTVDVNNTRDVGRIAIVKVVDGAVNGETLPPFKVDVNCDGTAYDQTGIVVTPGVTSYTGSIPTGTTCRVSEEASPTGYSFVSISPSDPQQPSTALVSVGLGDAVQVTVTNKRNLGHLVIVKKVSGPLAGASGTFSITVNCGSAGTFVIPLTVSSDNGTAQGATPNVPTGTTCAISETPDPALWTASIDKPQVTVTDDTSVVTVTVTNTRKIGVVTITKSIEGGTATPGTTFLISLDCAGTAYDHLNVPFTPGQTISFDVPTGVSCTVTEPNSGLGWTQLSITPSGAFTVGTTAVTVSVVNVRQRAELTVRKTGGDAALAGAQFALYRDNGDGQFSATSDTVVGGCTTASAGLCSVTVDWGSSYFWYEKTAPAGYNLPTTQWQGPIAVTAANVTTTFPVTSFNDTRTGVTTTPSAGPVVIAPQPGTSGSVQTMFDSATLTGLSRDATGTVTFQLFGPFTGAAAVTCDATPAFISSGNAISLVGSSGAFVATSAVFTPKAAGLYQWRAIYTGDAKNAGITGTCPDATEQATVQAGPGPRVAKVADPATGSVVQPGSTITYTVTVSNVGDVPIVNGPVVDTLPANVTAVAGSVSDGGTVSADGRTVNWSVDLAAGASKQLTYKVTVDVGAPPGADLVNRVVFFDQQATTTHRTPTGNLTIVKSNSPTGTVAYGDSITYTMTVSATGTLDQPGVVVTDYVPGFDPADTTSLKTTYTSGSASCDGTCPTPTYAAGQLTWSLGTILAGTSRTVSFTVTVDRPTPAADGSIPGGDVRNVAVASSTLTPPTPSNQVVNAVTAVPATPTGALSITKANDPTGTVARGDRITYTLTVTASGTLTQTNVIVTDMVPGFDPADTTSLPTTYVDGSATCSGCSRVGYDATTHQVSWSLGDMAGGTSQTVSFAVTVDPVAAGTAAAAGEVRNTALVQSGQTAPTRSNQVVNGVAEVLGVKIAQPAPKVEGVKIAAPVATLPRTGPVAPLGATLWLAGMLLTVGLGLTVVGSRSRRRAQHRS